MFLSILLMLSLSCTHSNNVVPKGIIEPDKMGKVLTDFHLADAVSNQNFPVKGVNDSIVWKNKSFRSLILGKYHIDTAAFNRSFNYYVQRPAEMDSIYAKMITDLSRLQTRLSPDDAKEKALVRIKKISDSGKKKKSILHMFSVDSGIIKKSMPHFSRYDSMRKVNQTR